MEIKKFKEEVYTLKKFFQNFCKKKHSNQTKEKIELKYKGKTFFINLYLCEECKKTISYCFNRLLECPHEIKPRCRKCPNPCYEKKQWKEVAKIMRYSGLTLGLNTLNRKMKNILKLDDKTNSL